MKAFFGLSPLLPPTSPKKIKSINNKDLQNNLSPGDIIVRISEKYFRPAEVETLLGDASKAKTNLGWTPKVSFSELVQEMAEADLAEAMQVAKNAG